MAENKQLDARKISQADLPTCPMGCERVYLNLVNKQPLDGNYSPHNVDFVHCTKCDFQAPIEKWKQLPGIYSQGIVGNISEQDLINGRDVILDLIQDFFAGEIPVMEDEAYARVELVFEKLAESAEKQAAAIESEGPGDIILTTPRSTDDALRSKFHKLCGILRGHNIISAEDWMNIDDV